MNVEYLQETEGLQMQNKKFKGRSLAAWCVETFSSKNCWQYTQTASVLVNPAKEIAHLIDTHPMSDCSSRLSLLHLTPMLGRERVWLGLKKDSWGPLPFSNDEYFSVEKVQKELDAVLGPSQMICYEHRRKVPYTNAVIHEIQRFSNIISIGMPRVCVRNTTLLGFPLKKVPFLTVATVLSSTSRTNCGFKSICTKAFPSTGLGLGTSGSEFQ